MFHTICDAATESAVNWVIGGIVSGGLALLTALLATFLTIRARNRRRAEADLNPPEETERKRERSQTALINLIAERAADRAVKKHRESVPVHPAVEIFLLDVDQVVLALQNSAAHLRERLGLKRPEPTPSAHDAPAPTPDPAVKESLPQAPAPEQLQLFPPGDAPPAEVPAEVSKVVTDAPPAGPATDGGAG